LASSYVTRDEAETLGVEIYATAFQELIGTNPNFIRVYRTASQKHGIEILLMLFRGRWLPSKYGGTTAPANKHPFCTE
jgi:hypothetical protein